MNEVKQQINLEERQQIFQRLAHFTAPPLITSGNLPESILDNLIEHVLYLENQVVPADKIPNLIKSRLNLSFDYDEVKASLERLMAKKLVVKSLKGGVSLEACHRANLQRIVNQKIKQEQQILRKFEERIKNTYSQLTSEHLEQLKNDFQKFLINFFLLVGAEAIQLIYGNPKEISGLFDKVQKKNIFDLLPIISADLKEIEQKEFINFVNLLSGQEKLYLQDLLDRSLQYFTITVDKNCEALLIKDFNQWKLFVDTNFLYSLLGLDGSRRKKYAEQILELSKEAKISFFVSPVTLEEFSVSVARARELLLSEKISRKLFKVAGDVTGNSVLSAYYEAYAQNRINPKDFLAKIENIKDVLKAYGIEEKTDYSQSIKGTKEFNETVKKMIALTGKEQHIAEHDTFHYLLVLKLRSREGADNTFGTNKSWFLTYDSLLVPFDFEIRKVEIPFCIRSYQLRQILRPLFSRTDDFESVFIDFVAEPTARAFPTISTDIAMSILARITYFEKEFSIQNLPELATKILTNQYFINQLRDLRADESQRIKLIDSKIKQITEIPIDKVVSVAPPRTTTPINYWNFVNPFWLLWKFSSLFWKFVKKILGFIKKHRVLSILSFVVITVSLLGIDYSLAWKNVKAVIRFLVNLSQ